MTDYRAIDETETDEGAPPVVDLFKALAKNPVAITEGADGAPRVQWKAMKGSTLVGYLTGTGTNPLAFTGLAGLRSLRFTLFTSGGGSNFVPQFAISTDGGSNWGSYINIGSSSEDIKNHEGYINCNSGSLLYRWATNAPTYQWDTGSFTAVPNINAIRFRMSASQGTNQIQVALFRDGSGE